MNILSIVQLVLQYGPMVKSIVDEATSNESVVQKITALSGPFASILAGIGGTLFPKVKPSLQVAAGVAAAFDPNITKWVQGSLNVLLIPSPNLVVDGIYGPKTKAAVETLQSLNGLTVDGWAGQLTQGLISSLLAKQPVIK